MQTRTEGAVHQEGVVLFLRLMKRPLWVLAWRLNQQLLQPPASRQELSGRSKMTDLVGSVALLSVDDPVD